METKNEIKSNDTILIKSIELKKLNSNFHNLNTEIHKKNNTVEPKFMGATYDTVFTVTVTLGVFIIGILIDRFFKNKQENEENRDLKTYFFNQLGDIKELVVPNLIKGYKDYYQENIGIDDGIPATAPIILTNSFERLLKMESDKLFKSFNSFEKENFNKYFNEIDFLSNLRKEVEKYHSIVLKRSEISRNLVVELHNSFHKCVIAFLENQMINNPNYETNSSYILINNRLSFYNRELAGKRNLKKYYNEFVRPIQIEVTETNLFREDLIAREIAENGKMLSNKYNELRRIITEVRLQYRIFMFQIIKSFGKLKSLLELKT